MRSESCALIVIVAQMVSSRIIVFFINHFRFCAAKVQINGVNDDYFAISFAFWKKYLTFTLEYYH
jgi:hypothetical protein